MKTLAASISIVLLTLSPAQAQETEGQGLFNRIPFETIPGDALIQGAGGIGLQSDVTISGDLAVQGMVGSAGGILYSDGTLQTTAAGAPEGFSANAGMYANRIADFVPAQPFSEICFKNGQVMGDIHASSESTQGGDCLPGDLGWVIERNQRALAFWENARVACLLEGMRLPELFEYTYSCRNSGTYGLNGMSGDWEWSSNSVSPIRINTTNGVVAAIAGGTSCSSSGPAWMGTTAQFSDSLAFRCLR